MGKERGIDLTGRTDSAKEHLKKAGVAAAVATAAAVVNPVASAVVGLVSAQELLSAADDLIKESNSGSN